ncbi:MAG: 5'/3'-nucleotidase SurE [Myxococcota bacterium]
MSTPRILLSNDDGIDAPGLTALTEGLQDLGELWVVAPERERSAASHAISLHKPLRIKKRQERRYAVSGTPSDCVYMALNHLMSDRAPDVIVSGINAGPNLGNDVLYSGTVAAAMEGALFGIRAVAVSLDLRHSGPSPGGPHYRTAAEYLKGAIPGILATEMPAGVVLNVNVPNRPSDAIVGSKLCRLGYTDWTDAVSQRQDPRGRNTDRVIVLATTILRIPTM